MDSFGTGEELGGNVGVGQLSVFAKDQRMIGVAFAGLGAFSFSRK